MAVTALVLGIIGLVFSFIPVLNVIGLILAFLGVIFGAVGIKNRDSRGKAIAGLVMSIIALGVAFWWVVVLGGMLAA